MYSKDNILSQFQVFTVGTGGIGNWLSASTPDEVFDRLGRIDNEPLSKVQLNQLLVLGHEAPVSDGFFRYYWLACPQRHLYETEKLRGFEKRWIGSPTIVSLAHLQWGLTRLFLDGLLCFGNVRTAFRQLRTMDETDLTKFFGSRRFDTDAIRARGPALPLHDIAKDDRYLISEMACKTYGDSEEAPGDFREVLTAALEQHVGRGASPPTVRELLEGDFVRTKYNRRQQEFVFSADDVLSEVVASADDLRQKYDRVATKFYEARRRALCNTNYFLSMVSELDVYVATSMRDRQDFRNMATACEAIFDDPRLRDLHLRYFDPTLSAARGHEDKGLIECLMVKCAKVLIYCAGKKESYGKDAEAAMALSLGKPVIFYCDEDQRSRFYRDVHPLSRLIEFGTGIAVGALVTDSTAQVSELLFRIFHNKMEYEVVHPKPGYLRLKDRLTDSVVRLQTNDELLTQTFWNHYHNK